MTKIVVSVSDNIIAFGPSQFLREVAIPVATAMEDVSKEHPPSPNDAAWDPEVELHPYADWALVAGLVTVVVFVSGWVAEKALDEIYSVKLGPLLRERLSIFLRGEPTNKKYAASLMVNNSSSRVSILVVSVGCTIQEIECSERQTVSVAALGMEKAQQLSADLLTKPGEVHVYIVEGGSSNEHPWIYQNLSAALEHLRSMNPAKHLKLIRNGS